MSFIDLSFREKVRLAVWALWFHIRQARNSRWRKIRAEHLKEEPECQWTGRRDNLQVHHTFPVHLYPQYELYKPYLITLAGSGSGKTSRLLYWLKCTIRKVLWRCKLFEKKPDVTNPHLTIGHNGNWKDFNPHVREACELHKVRRS